MPESSIAERIKVCSIPCCWRMSSRGLTASARRLLEYETSPLTVLTHSRCTMNPCQPLWRSKSLDRFEGNLADAEAAGCLVLELAGRAWGIIGAFKAMSFLIDEGVSARQRAGGSQRAVVRRPRRLA